MKPREAFPHSRISTEKTAVRDGISIEEQMRKAMSGNEPIQATAKVTYNDRKDGVLPQHDIRTDRFEVAMMATDRIHATQAAARRGADAYSAALAAGKSEEEAAAARDKAAGQPIGEA